MARFLVIDDDEQCRILIHRILEMQGHEVTGAVDGVSGWETYKAIRPDVVITDILMPDTDGIELIRMLREDDPGIPIITISGGGQGAPELYLSSSEYLGATRTLAKPFGKTDLLNLVESVLAEPR